MSSSTSSSDLKKLMLRIVIPLSGIMILLLLVIDPVLTHYMILPPQTEGPAKIYRIMNEEDADEIPIIGTSRILNSVNPDSISSHAWNYGINGMSFPLFNVMLSFELQKKKTAPLIIGLDANLFDDSLGPVINFLPFSRSEIVKHQFAVANEDRFYYQLPGLRYYGMMERYFIRFMTSTRKGVSNCSHYKGSSICALHRTNDELLARSPIADINKIEYLDSTMNLFLDIILQHPERKFILVSMPMRPIYQQTVVTNPPYSLFLESAQKLSNVVFLNFSKENLPEDYFQDFSHMNKKGADWFSGTLRKRIQAAGLNMLP